MRIQVDSLCMSGFFYIFFLHVACMPQCRQKKEVRIDILWMSVLRLEKYK